MSNSRSGVSEVIDILVDVSGSMGERPDGGTAAKDDPTKLRMVRMALAENVIPMLRNDVAFGLKYFGGDCKTGARTIAEPKLNQADVIRGLLQKDEQPTGKTPLAAALRASFNHLMGYPDADKKMLVFTDGAETCESPEALEKVIKEFENHNFTVTKGRLSIHAIAVGKVNAATKAQLDRIAVQGSVQHVEEIKGGDFTAMLGEAAKAGIEATMPAQTQKEDAAQAAGERRPQQIVSLAPTSDVRSYLIAIILIQLMTAAALAYVAANMTSAARPAAQAPSSEASRGIHDKLDIQAEAIESLSSAVKALKEDIQRGR